MLYYKWHFFISVVYIKEERQCDAMSVKNESDLPDVRGVCVQEAFNINKKATAELKVKEEPIQDLVSR